MGNAGLLRAYQMGAVRHVSLGQPHYGEIYMNKMHRIEAHSSVSSSDVYGRVATTALAPGTSSITPRVLGSSAGKAPPPASPGNPAFPRLSYKESHTVCVFFVFLPLSVMFLRLIRVVACQ